MDGLGGCQVRSWRHSYYFYQFNGGDNAYLLLKKKLLSTCGDSIEGRYCIFGKSTRLESKRAALGLFLPVGVDRRRGCGEKDVKKKGGEAVVLCNFYTFGPNVKLKLR